MTILEKEDWKKLIIGMRKLLNLSQTQLSKRISLGRSVIGRFERSQRIPNIESSKKLLRFVEDNNLDIKKLLNLGTEFTSEPFSRQKLLKLNLQPSKNLAELVGVILGDGEIRPDCIRISFDPKKDLNFLYRRVFFLIKETVDAPITFESSKRICVNNIAFVRYLNEDCKIKSGSKSKNNSTIPEWIFRDIEFIKSVIRGIFDTDGYIGYDKHSIEIMFGRFTDKCTNLVNNIQKSLILLKIEHNLSHTSDGRYVITILGNENVIKFFNLVGTSNLKHIVRFLLWRIYKYPAKIEIEGLESLILKLNIKNIQEVELPFLWNKNNILFYDLVKEDLDYLNYIKIRNTYKWEVIACEILKKLDCKTLAQKLNIGERSLRRWKDGSRTPAVRFMPQILAISKGLELDLEDFKKSFYQN